MFALHIRGHLLLEARHASGTIVFRMIVVTLHFAYTRRICFFNSLIFGIFVNHGKVVVVK